MHAGRGVSILASVVAAGALGACAGSPTPSHPPATIDLSQPWTAVAPTQAGLDPNLLARAVADAQAIPRFRSLLVARDGQLTLEHYFAAASADTRFDVRSVTKSVVSMLIGIALSEGTLPSLDATVGQYLGPPYAPDAGERAVTVRELLTMTSGFAWNDDSDYDPWILSDDHIQFLLDRPQVGPPGPFTYNSAAVHLLGVLLQLATETPLPSYADERLFQPLGITSAQWEALDRGTVNGGSGLQLQPRDLLRLGQLVLQEGRSGSREVVPSSWMAQMTAPRFPWRDNYGAQRSVTYGYLWWVADAPAVPASFAWGYGGQFVYVVPSLQLVVVATTEWRGLAADNLNAVALAEQVLGVVVDDVIPSVTS